MAFTDDELAHLKTEVKRLNAFQTGDEGAGGLFDDVLRLIARLEAAEKVCAYVDRWLVTVVPNTAINKPMIEWRKAAGK